jgi:hypothetical protein
VSVRISTRRKNQFNLFREAQKLGSFDEFPMLRPEVDPQVHLSRNTVDQPFYLLCEKDTVIAQFSGRSRVVFQEGSVRYFDVEPGDFVYAPGGVAYRILTLEPGHVMRYKARQPGRETVLWLCKSCGTELVRETWNANERLPQEAYQAACERYNAQAASRRCGSCGTEHTQVDLSAFRWSAVAEALSHPDDDE